MSKKKKPIVTYEHKPIPTPPTKDLGTGLVFLVASFFNNTQSFDIEHADRNSRFSLRYRGYGYSQRRRNKRKVY